MGYDVHITRRSTWADDDGPAITFDEWCAYVATDPQVQPDPVNKSTDFLVFTGDGQPWPLWWWRGEVYTKRPDRAAIAKLVQIAGRLNARVLGDDDEVYTADSAFENE
jgi:hypothetical protein